MQTKREKLLTSVVILGLLILCSLAWPMLKGFVDYAISVLRYPYVWAMTENENMLFIKGVMSGENIYNLKGTESFLYDVYPPLFHLLTALLTKLLGFKILIPRLISISSLLGFFITLFLFFKDRLKALENLLVTLLLSAFTLGLSYYAKYYVLARADMLAVALGFGSLFCLFRIYHHQKEPRFTLFAGLFAIAALFTKQSVFFPYLVIALLTLVIKDRKSWLVFIAYVAALTIGLFLTLNLITSGGFWQSMQIASEIYGKYLNSTQHLWLLQTAFIKHYWPLLIGVAALIGLSIRSIISRKAPIPFSLFVSLAIYLNFIVTGGNQGAEYNSLIPLVFGLMLVTKELSSIRPLGLILFFALSLTQISVFRTVTLPYLLPTVNDRLGQEKLIDIVQTSSKPWVLGDRVDYATILAGKSSPLEASTHNVARDALATQPYAKLVEGNLLKRLEDGQIDQAIITITNFGKGDLYSYITSHGSLLDTVKISYLDAPELNHKIYQIRP